MSRVTATINHTRKRAFHVTPNYAATAQPFAPGLPTKWGHFLGQCLRTMRALFYDIHKERQLGRSPSTNSGVTGQTRSGKTGLLKQIFMRQAARHAGVDEHGNDIESICHFYTDKSNPGESPAIEARSEIEDLIDYLQGTMVYMEDLRGVNIFTPYYGSTPLEIVELSHIVGREVKGTGLSPVEGLIQEVTASIMFGDQPYGGQPRGEINSLIYAGIQRGIRYHDLLNYYDRQNQFLLREFEQELRERPDLRRRFVIKNYPPNISRSEFEHAAGVCAAYWDVFHGGRYGGLYGGKVDMATVMDDEIVGIEMGGLTIPAREMHYTLTQRSMRKHSRKGGNPRYMPNLRISDEGSRSAVSASWVEARADNAVTTSERMCWEIIASQYASQLLKVGDVDSALRSRAEETDRATGSMFYGQLVEGDPSIEVLERAGVSQSDIAYMRKFKPGCFGLLVPGQDIVLFRSLPTPDEWRFIGTNQGVTRMTHESSTDLSDFEDEVERMIDEHGLIRL